MSEYSCHLICHYRSEHGRISFIARMELPFVPANGMDISITEDEPPVTVETVEWSIAEQAFTCSCGCQLEDWEESMFLSIKDSFYCYDAELFPLDKQTISSVAELKRLKK